MGVLSNIQADIRQQKKQLVVLLDPEKTEINSVARYAQMLAEGGIRYVLVGGSGYNKSIDQFVRTLKEQCEKYYKEQERCKILLFPGSTMQISEEADAILFLTLVSSRNAEMLIGRQTEAALTIKKKHLEAIPMGYILIDGGKESSVEKVSMTEPLSQDDRELIVRTAVASELLGQQMIYLEAGSGAKKPVGLPIIRDVRKNIGVPLIAGGGICNVRAMTNSFKSGADWVVVGNWFEQHPEDIPVFAKAVPNKSLPKEDDEKFMRLALDEAEKAFEEDEIPVGCVLVKDGKVLSSTHNQTQTFADITAHAEIQALKEASKILGTKYLTDCTMYVTLEPCAMCATAIGWAQVGRLIYGAKDDKKGYTQFAPDVLHPKCSISSGILEKESKHLLQDFFAKKRGK